MKRFIYITMIVCLVAVSVAYCVAPSNSNLVVVLYFSCVLCGTLLRDSYLTYLKNVKHYNTLYNEKTNT